MNQKIKFLTTITVLACALLVGLIRRGEESGVVNDSYSPWLRIFRQSLLF